MTTLSDEMSGEDWDAPTALRLRLLGEHARAISELEQREEEIACEITVEETLTMGRALNPA